MNTRRYFIFFLLAGAMVFISCNDFLDIDSANDVDDGNMFTDGESLISARFGLYNALQSDAYYGGLFPLMIDGYSDNGAAGGYDSPQLNQFNDKALGADNIFVDNFWVSAYYTIYTANQILDHVDEIEDPALSDELRNDIRGEALTIRALAQFDLLRTFGEHWDLSSSYGIPIVLEGQDPLIPHARNTVQACYDAILLDLESARSLVSPDDLIQESGPKTAAFITPSFVNALMARVYLYMKDYSQAAARAEEVIVAGNFIIAADPALIYSERLATESIFELQFNVQDQSQYNNLTYVRDDALRVDVSFLANEDLQNFFLSRPGDGRASLVNFNPDENDGSIQPDGRTQKYRGEESRDNPAYLLRISELYQIRAEALGATGDYAGCQAGLQAVADYRGWTVPTVDAGNMVSVVLDERRAELNFEGHRYFDLARHGLVSEVVGEDVLPVFPIPINQIAASGGVIEQYPGY